ncbi:hypothetical protein ABKN59_006650 [Abortiporus biennis]
MSIIDSPLPFYSQALPFYCQVSIMCKVIKVRRFTGCAAHPVWEEQYVKSNTCTSIWCRNNRNHSQVCTNPNNCQQHQLIAECYEVVQRRDGDCYICFCEDVDARLHRWGRHHDGNDVVGSKFNKITPVATGG